jgi:deoxyadenosine/deoxycytidine kinase
LDKLKQNIKSRNRDYEQNIQDDYLIELQNAYLQLIKSEKFKTLIIDTTQTDFLHNSSHFDQLLVHLEKEYEDGHHFINFT